jgi:hypothetical protein
MSFQRGARWLWIVTLFVAAATSGICRHAIAQTSKTSVPASFDYSKLADAIQGSFPIANVTAYVGNDWCFQVETDTSKNCWYFNYRGSLTAYPSEYGSRIRVLYKNANNKWDGASVFIAFETLVFDHYNIPTDSSRGFLKNHNTITFPVSPYSSCPLLKDFLTAIFSKYWTDWRIWGEGLCTSVRSI